MVVGVQLLKGNHLYISFGAAIDTFKLFGTFWWWVAYGYNAQLNFHERFQL
jgi:hypothetical protein